MLYLRQLHKISISLFVGAQLISPMSLRAATTPIKLNIPLPANGYVSNFLVNPNSQSVAYQANPNAPDLVETYSVSANGGDSTLLNNEGYGAKDIKISPNGQWVVYKSSDAFPTLFSVPTLGPRGATVNLGSIGFYSSFEITPDSTHIVFSGNGIYSVPISGGLPVKLTDIVGIFQISQNGQWIVISTGYDLYTVSVNGGSATKINLGYISNGGKDFLISPDGRHVVYHSITTDKQLLYSVPIDGHAESSIPLSTPLSSVYSEGRVLKDFIVSTDSSFVLYISDQGTRGIDELYSISLSGGTPKRINGDLVVGDDVASFDISQDSLNVVYQTLKYEGYTPITGLYSVSVGGENFTKLEANFHGFYYTNLKDDGPYKISSDSSRVIYIKGITISGYDDSLYSIPLKGGPITKLNPSQIEVDHFFISRTNRVIYSGSSDADRIYDVPLAGGVSTPLNNPIVKDGRIWDFAISPDGSHVVYIADQETLNKRELYSVELPQTPPSIGQLGIIRISDTLNGELYPSQGSRTVDGNILTISMQLSPTGSEPIQGTLTVLDENKMPLGQPLPISHPATSESIIVNLTLDSLGLARDRTTGELKGQRSISVRFQPSSGSLIETPAVTFRIVPRPAVLVHGYKDDETSWITYRDTFLKEINVDGYIVDILDTGGRNMPLKASAPASLSDFTCRDTPFVELNEFYSLIAQNAARLKLCIDKVKRHVGAERVDIVAHSMGGLISRYYIDRLMSSSIPDVHQLIMLGTPNAGSYGSNLLAAVLLTKGTFFELTYAERIQLRAAIDLLPYTMAGFNMVIHERRGVPFALIAGNYACTLGLAFNPPNFKDFPPLNPIEPLPNDIIVAVASAFAIPLDFKTVIPSPIVPDCIGRHEWMRSNKEVWHGGPEFFANVSRLLRSLPPVASQAPTQPQESDPSAAYETLTASQSTAVMTGTLRLGERLEYPVTTEAGASNVSFVVAGSPDTVTVNLRDPNGRVFTPTTNDPSVQYTRVDLMGFTSYTVSTPSSGTWTVVVEPNAQTPSGGVVVAVVSSFSSNLRLTLPAPTTVPSILHPLAITAQIHNDTTAVLGANVNAWLWTPEGQIAVVTLRDDGQSGDGAPNDGLYGYQFIPMKTGTYSAAIRVTGTSGSVIFERSAIWAVEVTSLTYLPLIKRSKT